MTAKQYLNQIKYLSNRINNKLEEKEQLFTIATKTSSGQNNPDIVKTSHDDQKNENLIVECVELEKEILQLTARYLKARKVITTQIDYLHGDNEKYYNLLYKRYVLCKNFASIAVDMGYAYETIRNMHTEAMQVFHDNFREEYQAF